MEVQTFPSENCKGEPREVEVHFNYEPAWRGTQDVQGTGATVDIRKVLYNGRNVIRLLSKKALEFMHGYIEENYCDEPFEEFDYD